MNTYVDYLLHGVAGGAVVFLVASIFGRWSRVVLALALIDAGAAYVRFAVNAGTGAGWIGLELSSVVAFGAIGLLGVRRSPWWLVAGWALHPIWDLGMHLTGPGHAFAPEAYSVSCVTWDWMVAGLLAIAIRLRGASSGMTAGLKAHFEFELAEARRAERARDFGHAWRSLERAHVLSQAHALPHVRVHGAMAGLALRRLEVRELLGQLPRLVLAAPGSWLGRAPLGNTGRSNVGIFTPMPISEDLQAKLDAARASAPHVA